MTSQSNRSLDPEIDREIVASTRVGAPLDKVYAVWIDAEHLSRWFGPNGFTTTTHGFEFRPGGVWEFTMHGPDGTDYPNWVEWIEIEPLRRLFFRHGAQRDDPEAFLSTVTFDREGDATRVTMRATFGSKELRDRAIEEFGAVEGAEQTLGRMAAHATQTGPA